MERILQSKEGRLGKKLWSCIFFLGSVMVLMACGTLTAAQQAERALAVENALQSRHYTVDVQMMYPNRGVGRNVTSNYSLEVKGDTLVSYLPYFGRAYSVPYGGGKALNFTAPIKRYQSAKGSKGRTLVDLVIDNEEDVITYHIEVFDNGQTTIDVIAREREPISYSGELVWQHAR
jgi:hypothetical protein